ncbi:WLM domain-containing protein [Crucibulum laeve]|uniref:WLM domain-containing protein n=1 Tax=Crucibulum laeve TaxID=68775 RepID=A0A5C3M6L3_9AGAR|nr:WLM domain-containing protein [Crucibulum laeve]
MVHLRLNESESNPNPHINFITALTSWDATDYEDARQLLRALAAQVRPVMKAHGFTVNSFEEYEHNRVFLGRNWNAGETVGGMRDGSFYPTSMLMSTLCHELAHIQHMNHGPGFQALWKRLRMEVRQLQDKGYYGDGYWSSGTRLADSARVSGEGIEAGDFPEYICGGAQTRARPTATRRRRTGGPRRETVASLHTGWQTAKKRKAGARVNSKYAFAGEGATLAEDVEDAKGKGKGTGFGKQAASKRAREERALAAEKRMQALLGKNNVSTPQPSFSKDDATAEDGSDIDDSDVEFVGETDAERRETLLAAEKEDGVGELKPGSKISWDDFEDDFNFTGAGKELDEDSGCDVPVASGSTFTTGSGSSSRTAKEKGKEAKAVTKREPSKSTSKSSGELGIGKLVQSEIDLRKKESLGIAPVKGGSRTLGGSTRKITNALDNTSRSRLLSSQATIPPADSKTTGKWSCLVCTLENEADHLACAACTTPQGDMVYSQRA